MVRAAPVNLWGYKPCKRLDCCHGYTHQQCGRGWQVYLTPSSQASMWGTGFGDQREGQQGRYRHGRDGQSRGLNALGAGDMGLRPV